MIPLMFVTAVSLSAVAAFYSIIGLVAIFAASPIPIIIMGSMLEVSKLIVASWIYRYWKLIPILLKTYFSIALIILMFLTSMGIYGFLSKAHIEHNSQSFGTQLTIDEINRQIQLEKSNINDATNVIAQLDKAVNVLSDAQRIRGPDGALAVRHSQQKEREHYNRIISNSNSVITNLEKRKVPLITQQQQIETEVGPIKYIAALIYDDVNASVFEKAIRGLILIIVVVFDPLAVLLLIAANWTLLHHKKQKTFVITSDMEYNNMTGYQRNPVTKAEILAGPSTTKNVVEDINNLDVNEFQDSNEHPVFKPEEKFWRSRPTNS